MIAGAREGALSGLRRLASAAMARDLHAIVVPGPEVARARGLDIESAGLRIAATPRHANVLLLVGPVPRELDDAVTILYAQMMRPRALFSLGTNGTPSSLPHADVAADLSQSGLLDGIARLRSAFSRGAFRPGVSDFDAPALQIRIEYTCPMHPEVVQSEPGSCPKCGMTLVPREASDTAESHHGAHHNMAHAAPTEYTCPMHPEVVQDQPGSCPKCGMTLVSREASAAAEPHHGAHHGMAHAAPAAYTCPMHPEVVQDQPGPCPKCGMTLVPREASAATEHHHGAHHGMAHDAPATYTCPMHPEVVQDQPGSCPKCGMTLVPREVSTAAEPHHGTHHGMAHETMTEYTCPMHPEVVQDQPGSCPKCGMNLVPRETAATMEPHHGAHHDTKHGVSAEYTCPMHPEVVQNQPGSCPKCGMTLVPREASAAEEPHHGTHHDMAHAAPAAYTCPMHPDVVQNQPGSCPKCGMTLVPREASATMEPHHGTHHGMGHDAPAEYTCPMHLEIVQDQPGSCPKCGMNLVPRKAGPADEHKHTQAHQNADMDHGDMDFMSMVEVTKDLPRSPDDLPMDWIEVPFGPFFPGLPGGLLLTLTLDGDGIAKTRAQSLVGGSGALPASGMGAADFVDHLGATDPLAPVGYRLLACRALEAAAGQIPDEEILRGRIAAVERERIASHLGWLALFAQQIGFDWLHRHAASLQLQFLHADIKQVMALNLALQALIKRLQRTPLLKSRTAGIGRMTPDPALRGPVARATGVSDDARSRDKTYSALGFTAVSRDGGDALARLHVRLDETRHSLALIEATGVIVPPALINIGEASGAGKAVVETPRGEARLQLTLDNGRVTEAQLDTPSTHHLDRVEQLLERQELGDGLTAVVSLDLSPWEVVQ